MTRLILILIGIYKSFFSKPLKVFFGGGCRFTPTCSEYAYEAVQKYGVLKGISLASKRILRCNAFSPVAFDPVN
jgi:hypothetical protein